MWSTHTNWWATKELQENEELAADKHANLRVQDLARGLGAMQTDDGMCPGRGTGRKKVGIDTQVWRKSVTCKTELVNVLVSLSPAPPHHSLSCLHVKPLLVYLCVIPYAVCVCECCRHQVSATGRTSANGSGISSGSQVRDVGCDLVWGGPDRRGHVSTPGIHWCACLCESRVCWVCAVSTEIQPLPEEESCLSVQVFMSVLQAGDVEGSSSSVAACVTILCVSGCILSSIKHRISFLLFSLFTDFFSEI